MDASQQSSTRRWLNSLPAETIWQLRAAASPEWQLVRRWPGISAEDKLAWCYLWATSRCGSELISVTPTMVAEDQQVTSDAGRARLKNLQAEGLIKKCPAENRRGRWLIEVLELDELRQLPKARRVKWDGQRQFFDDDDDQDDEEQLSDDVEQQPCAPGLTAEVIRCPRPIVSAKGTSGGSLRQEAEEPPEEPPPANRGTSGGSSFSRHHETMNHESASAHETIHHDHAPIPHENHETIYGGRARGGNAQGGAPSPAANRGTSGGSSPDVSADGPQRIGGLAAQVLAGVRTEAQQLAAAHELQAAILGRVRDADLNRDCVLRLCTQVVTGRIAMNDVAELLADLERKRSARALQKSPGAYFMGGMKRLFKQAECVD